MSSASGSLEDQFAIAAARFHTLAADCRLSFLEIKLYRKYFVETSPKTPEKLSRLKMIIETLEQHRANTIAVLKAIHEREQIVDGIHGQIDRINTAHNKNANILDYQSDGLHLIYLHQQVTLRVVEAIETWRRPLTRPFPFVHQGENYFAKVLADCQAITSSSLGKILPVKLAQYPLCSDLPSLCLFVTANPAATVARGAKHPPTRMTSEMSAKIHSAQNILLEEMDIQKKLLRELEGLSSAGFFLPVLNLHSIIPSSASGIRMSNHEWEEQLRGAIAEAKEDLEVAEEHIAHPPPLVTSSSSPAAGGGGGAGGHHQQHHATRGKYSDSDIDSDDDSSSNNSSSPGSSPKKAAGGESSTSGTTNTRSSNNNNNNNSTAPATPTANSSSGAKKQVSIEERPGSAAAAPQPPPRPTSAKKQGSLSAAPPSDSSEPSTSATSTARSSSRPGSAKKVEASSSSAAARGADYDEDEFEDEDEL